MPQAIADFINATSRLRIFEQAEAAMEEQLRNCHSNVEAAIRKDREQEITDMHVECEADARKYVEDGVLADMDVVYNTPLYCSFMASLTKVRAHVRETRSLLSMS